MDAVARIREARIVAILRRVPAVERVCDELVAAGITVLEVTLDSDDALETIARLRARGDATVLAGTVRTEAEAAAAIAAGAEACVGPSVRPRGRRAMPAARRAGDPGGADADRGRGRLAGGRGARQALPRHARWTALSPRARGSATRHSAARDGRDQRRQRGRLPRRRSRRGRCRLVADRGRRHRRRGAAARRRGQLRRAST